MSLQVRLRHPLGEQWLELPERGVDHPLGVGRESGADVQVPSVTVGQKHAVLFVHDGRWVVQDVAPGGPGTYLNGARVEGAAFLHVGDIVTLGAGPAAPAIEIDPNAADQGQGGQPAAAAAPPRAPTPEPPSAPAYGPPYVAPPAYPGGYPQYPGGYTVPAGTPQWPYAGTPAAPPAAVAEGSIADWPTDATPRYYTPRRRRTSDGSNGVVIGMLLTLAITAGTGYWIYRQRQSGTPTVQSPVGSTQSPSPAPKARTPDDSADAPPSIFNTAQPRAATTSGTATQPATRGTAVVSGVPAPVDPGTTVPPVVQTEPPMTSDPQSGATASTPPDASPTQDAAADAGVSGDDPAWKQVETARFLKDEAKAILQFDDYARAHPGAASEKLQQYTENMLDRIWFERIENLCEQREELNKKVIEVDKDMAEETDADYKKRVLVPLRQQYMTRLQGIEEELTQNMKYAGKGTPNLLDDAELDKLRQVRDPQGYAAWKVNVLAHIRKTHGELPWVATKSR